MRRVRVAVLALVIAVTGLFVPTQISSGSTPPSTTYYLALGDSLAYGYSPDHPEGLGYADILYQTLKDSRPTLQLIKLGCPGESTTSMINGPPADPHCDYSAFGGATSQLAAAVGVLNRYGDAVTFLTIDVGSNDVLPCASDAGIDTGCVQRGTAEVTKNLPTILDTLRDNVSRRTKTAGMTYYDPVLALWPVRPDIAQQSVLITNVFNLLEAANYFRYGFRVAPVAFAFQTNNFWPSRHPGSHLPVNAQTVCDLTFACTAFKDIHPNQTGYELIARTFGRTFGVSR